MRPEPCKTFKALGILLWYPDEEWLAGASDLCGLLEAEGLLRKEDLRAVRAFVESLAAADLFEAQEAYVETFDRMRSLSLHLFEHVHGESRDRGQAMVDLAERYHEQGFMLAKSELPDYLPVFLEYLSSVPKDEALEMLAEPGHVLAAVGKRLAERGSPYHVVFDALTRLAGRVPEKVTRTVAVLAPTPEQLDKEWEEKPILFLDADAPQSAGGGCGGGCSCGTPSTPLQNGARP